MCYECLTFSGIIPLGRYRKMSNKTIPINKYLKYGTLSNKCKRIAFCGSSPDVIKLIKKVVIGATSIQANQITNPPNIAPRLFPLPPTITIIQIINVNRSGLYPDGVNKPSKVTSIAPATPTMACLLYTSDAADE